MPLAVEVSRLIERQGVCRFTIGLVAWSSLFMLFDGYDLAAMSFAAPSVVRQWHIDRSSLGIIFSAGLAGMFFGGLLFGILGDRVGRKPAILGAVALLGAFSLLTALATTPAQLLLFRLGTGVAIGGLYPAAYALNIEMMPKRFAASVVILIMIGFSLGGVVGGLVSAWLIPIFGWQVMFWIGGALPLLLLPVFTVVLPESVRFLILAERPQAAIAAVLRRLDRGITIDPDATFVLRDEAPRAARRQAFTRLFQGRLRWMTPLLWLAYIACSTAVVGLSQWSPTLAEAVGQTHATAALATSAWLFGGMLGSLALMRFVDNCGALAIAVLPLLGVPVLLGLGTPGLGMAAFVGLMFLAGAFGDGGLRGLHSICGQFYPSDIRATGAGWALSVAKAGSVAGPWLGGVLLAAKLPPSDLYRLAALPLAVFLACIVAVGFGHLRMRREHQPGASDTLADFPAGAGGGRPGQQVAEVP